MAESEGAALAPVQLREAWSCGGWSSSTGGLGILGLAGQAVMEDWVPSDSFPPYLLLVNCLCKPVLQQASDWGGISSMPSSAGRHCDHMTTEPAHGEGALAPAVRASCCPKQGRFWYFSIA